jgi:hypothetical protein
MRLQWRLAGRRLRSSSRKTNDPKATSLRDLGGSGLTIKALTQDTADQLVLFSLRSLYLPETSNDLTPEPSKPKIMEIIVKEGVIKIGSLHSFIDYSRPR